MAGTYSARFAVCNLQVSELSAFASSLLAQLTRERKIIIFSFVVLCFYRWAPFQKIPGDPYHETMTLYQDQSTRFHCHSIIIIWMDGYLKGTRILQEIHLVLSFPHSGIFYEVAPASMSCCLHQQYYLEREQFLPQITIQLQMQYLDHRVVRQGSLDIAQRIYAH